MVDEQRRRGTRLTVIVVVLAAVTFVAGFFWATTRERVLSPRELQASGALLFEKARPLPAFTLKDDRGKAFMPATLQGRWNLIFFGYTYCPDICPTTMALLNDYYRQLSPEQRSDTRVLLASVDPARDTAQRLHEYVGYFHPDFRGVTGEFLEVHRFATGLSAPFSKVPGGGENYLVDHSGNIALVNPHGHFVGIIKAPLSVEQLNRVMPTFRAERG